MNVYISSIVIIDSKKEVHTIANDSKIDVEIIDMAHQQQKPKGRNSVQFKKPETTVIVKNAEAQKAIKPFVGNDNEVINFTIRLINANKIYVLVNASVVKEDDNSITIYAPSKINTRRNNG